MQGWGSTNEACNINVDKTKRLLIYSQTHAKAQVVFVKTDNVGIKLDMAIYSLNMHWCLGIINHNNFRNNLGLIIHHRLLMATYSKILVKDNWVISPMP